jgi:hypothetical protein
VPVEQSMRMAKALKLEGTHVLELYPPDADHGSDNNYTVCYSLLYTIQSDIYRRVPTWMDGMNTLLP